MKKTSIIALAAIATLAGYAVYRKKKADIRPFDNIGDIFPFIDTEGTAKHAVDALYWELNGEACNRKLAVLDKKINALTKMDYSEYSHIEKQGVYKEIDAIIAKLIELGFVITVPSYEREELVKYKTPAIWDVEALLSIPENPRRNASPTNFYYSDVQRFRELNTVVAATAKVLDKNTKKGIFADSRSFKTALFTEILRYNTPEHAIYAICYILDNTEMLPREGWLLMLKAYALKHCIETGKSYDTFNADDYFLAIELSRSLKEEDFASTIENAYNESDDGWCVAGDYGDIDEYDDINEDDFEGYDDDYVDDYDTDFVQEQADRLDAWSDKVGEWISAEMPETTTGEPCSFLLTLAEIDPNRIIRLPNGFFLDPEDTPIYYQEGMTWNSKTEELELVVDNPSGISDEDLNEMWDSVPAGRSVLLYPTKDDGSTPTLEEAVEYTKSLSDDEYWDIVAQMGTQVSKAEPSEDPQNILDNFVADTGRTVIQFPKGYSAEGKTLGDLIRDGVDYTEALSDEEYNQFQEGRNFDKPLAEGTYTMHRGMIVAPAGFEGTFEDALAYTDSLSDEEYDDAVQAFTTMLSELGEAVDLNALLDDANKTKTPRFVFGDDDTGLMIAPVRGMRMASSDDEDDDYIDGRDAELPLEPLSEDELYSEEDIEDEELEDEGEDL